MTRGEWIAKRDEIVLHAMPVVNPDDEHLRRRHADEAMRIAVGLCPAYERPEFEPSHEVGVAVVPDRNRVELRVGAERVLRACVAWIDEHGEGS